MPRQSRRRQEVLAVCATVGVLLTAMACSSGTASTASVTAKPTITVSAAPSSTGSAGSTIAPTTPSPAQDLATYAPAQPGGPGMKVVTPCDSGTFTVMAGPHGKGVFMTATLKGPVHAQWFGGVSITPWRNSEGEPSYTRYALTNGTLTLHGSNLKGADALRNPTLNYAWPQEVRAQVGAANGYAECNATVYLNATSAWVVSVPLDLHINRDTGVIKVQDSPLPGAGPWQITAVVTSAHGSQQQSRTVQARRVGNFFGAPTALATQFTDFTNLRDFTSITIKSAHKPDGAHAFQVTLSRFP